MITPLEVPDAVALTAFLDSPAGINLLKRLEEERPDFGSSKTIEETALIAREAKGWENCVKTVKQLAALRPTPEIEGGYLDTAKD